MSVELISYIDILNHRSKKRVTFIRISVILKEWYVNMFQEKYNCKIVRKSEINWFGRFRVIMDCPVKELPNVLKFSSTNTYKACYRVEE